MIRDQAGAKGGFGASNRVNAVSMRRERPDSEAVHLTWASVTDLSLTTKYEGS